MRTVMVAPPGDSIWTKIGIVLGWIVVAVVAGYCIAYALPLAMGGNCTWQLFTQGYCGSKSGLVLGAVLLLWPVAIFGAILRPMLFPLALYVFALPFDELTNINHVGTVNKLFGILSALTIIFMLVRHRRVIRPSTALVAWFSFAAWAWLSLLWSIVPAADNVQGPQFSITLLSLILLYTVLSVSPLKKSEFNILVTFMLAGATLAAMVGVYLFRSGGALAEAANLYSRHVSLGSVGAGNTTLDMNQVGASLILPFAFVTMRVLQTPWGIRKFMWTVPFTIILLGMYITKSRGMVMGMLVILAYFWWKSRYRLQIGAVAALGLVASVFAPAYHGATIWARFENDQAGGSGRLYIWKVGLAAFKQHFLIGAGWGNFPYAYNHAFITVFQRYYEWWNRGSHNILLWVGVELGVVGIAFMLWAFFSTFKSIGVIPKASSMYDVRVALEGAILGLFVSSMFLDTLMEKYLWLTFMLVAMARNVYLYAEDSDRVRVEAAAPLPAPQPAPPALRELRQAPEPGA